jgi:hypothetical protein
VAPVSTYEYANHIKVELRAAGVTLPFIFTPHPVVGMAPEVLDRYIVGNDPCTGQPVIDEIIAALTKPVSETTLDLGPIETVSAGPHEDVIGPDTEENLQRLFFDKGWTDGLPIILPTEDRVKKMLAGTSHAPEEVVGETALRNIKKVVKYTVSNIAVMAVMAGARPEHFPVILAIAATNQPSFFPSTTPFAGMILVNGPVRKEIGMNSGVGAFSPINLANSVIGRAWTIMSACWGYNQPMKTLWSAQGNNYIFNNMCVAENEERSVWTPFHVQKGFKAEESVVSIFRGWNLLNSLHAASIRTVGEEINLQLSVIPALHSSATIILDPLVARNIKENEGFATKQDYSRWLSQNCKIPAGRFWETDYIDMLVAPLAYKGVEPFASWKKASEDELIPHYNIPENINIVVVGGETSPLWKTTDYGYVTSSSIDKWFPDRSGVECKDGKCGLPDAMVKYD